MAGSSPVLTANSFPTSKASSAFTFTAPAPSSTTSAGRGFYCGSCGSRFFPRAFDSGQLSFFLFLADFVLSRLFFSFDLSAASLVAFLQVRVAFVVAAFDLTEMVDRRPRVELSGALVDPPRADFFLADEQGGL